MSTVRVSLARRVPGDLPKFLVKGFTGGANPIDEKAYYNLRAEVWGAPKEWLEAGASIPDDPELAADLTSITFRLFQAEGAPRQAFSVPGAEAISEWRVARPELRIATTVFLINTRATREEVTSDVL